MCGLDILLLRSDKVSDAQWYGDIDNRVKTLIDSLRVPVATEDYSNRLPADDEKPLFCLLEDDKLITKLSVETDQLLDLHSNKPDEKVFLVITARVRPYEVTDWNVEFA